MLSQFIIYSVIDYGIELMFDSIEYNLTMPTFEKFDDVKAGDRYGCVIYSDGDGRMYYYACTICWVDAYSVMMSHSTSCTFISNEGEYSDILCKNTTLVDRKYLKFNEKY